MPGRPLRALPAPPGGATDLQSALDAIKDLGVARDEVVIATKVGPVFGPAGHSQLPAAGLRGQVDHARRLHRIEQRSHARADNGKCDIG